MRNGTFFGTLGRDWASKDAAGKTVWENSLAVNVKKDETMWVKLSVWNEKQAETLGAWAKKGDKLVVSGDIEVRAYVSKDGDAKADLSCRVDKFSLVFSKKADDVASPVKVAAHVSDDEIPF